MLSMILSNLRFRKKRSHLEKRNSCRKPSSRFLYTCLYFRFSSDPGTVRVCRPYESLSSVKILIAEDVLSSMSPKSPTPLLPSTTIPVLVVSTIRRYGSCFSHPIFHSFSRFFIRLVSTRTEVSLYVL